jgi:tetratricopeptide (TPR) repeat protein
MRADNSVGYKQEDSLRTSVNFYHSRVDRSGLTDVVKYYTVFLMQQARKETDPQKQLFIIFKAVEFARMIVQYSPYSIHADAEALVFGVFSDLAAYNPAQFQNYFDTEQPIYALMKRLHFSPMDMDARLELGDLYVRQKSYYDAMAQYQYLLTRYPRIPRESDLPRGRVYIKIAEILQELIDYAEQESEQFQDARKLKNFIERYNRDFSERGATLTSLQNPNPAQIARAMRSMRNVANLWYQRALGVRLIGPRMVTKLVTQLANNHMKDGQKKEAQKLLTSAYRYWQRVPESVDSIEQRLDYLNLMVSVGMQVKQRDMIDFANQQLREYQNRLTELGLLEQAKVDRKEALLAGELVSE